MGGRNCTAMHMAECLLSVLIELFLSTFDNRIMLECLQQDFF